MLVTHRAEPYQPCGAPGYGACFEYPASHSQQGHATRTICEPV